MDTETLIALHLLTAEVAFIFGWLASELRHAKREHQRIVNDFEQDRRWYAR